MEEPVESPQIVKVAKQKLSFSKLDSPGTAGSVRKEEPEEQFVKVFLRIRPNHKDPNEAEKPEAEEENDAILVLDDTTVETVAPEDSQSFKNRDLGAKYTFSKIFGKPSKQEEIFDETTKSLCEALIEGKDALFFAYGVTNAGKTHTVEGNDEHPGIIPRALEKVFELVKEKVESKLVKVSYLQVYNEQVHDLQVGANTRADSKRKLQLKLREDGVEVEGLKYTKIKSADEGLKVLAKGREARTTHETLLNVQSSRSHSVFIINVFKNASDKSPARLYIVDLAGTERGKRTKTTRARQREASNINCSLMNLMRCLDTIRYNQKQKRLNRKTKLVPFRQSKLTMLFRDCFVGGNSGGVVMIVNASARGVDFDETAHALKYGALVKEVGVVTSKVVSRHSPSIKYGMDGRRLDGTDNMTSNHQNQRIFSNRLSTMSSVTAMMRTPPQNNNRESNIEYENYSWQDLRNLVYESHTRCITMESEIREEVGREMAERLAQMEQVFRERVETAKQICDSKSESMMINLKKRMKNHGSNSYTLQDMEELLQNICECEEEMERMRTLHAMDVDMLKKEIRNLKKTTSANTPHSQLGTPHMGTPQRVDEIQAMLFASPRTHSPALSIGAMNGSKDSPNPLDTHPEQLDQEEFVPVSQLDIIQDELNEERALHEKTNRQLIEVTELAESAMECESEAKREVVELRKKLDEAEEKFKSTALQLEALKATEAERESEASKPNMKSSHSSKDKENDSRNTPSKRKSDSPTKSAKKHRNLKNRASEDNISLGDNNQTQLKGKNKSNANTVSYKENRVSSDEIQVPRTFSTQSMNLGKKKNMGTGLINRMVGVWRNGLKKNANAGFEIGSMGTVTLGDQNKNDAKTLATGTPIARRTRSAKHSTNDSK